MVAFAILMALAGAAAGSFVALVAERLPRGQPVIAARSACRSCGATLRAHELIPLLSWPWLRGRCAHCGARIPSILWQAELVGALFGLLAALGAPDPARALLLAGWSWALLGLALADLRFFRLPDPLTAAAAVLGLGVMLAGDGTGWPDLTQRATDALAGGLAGGGAFWALRIGYRWRTGRDGMGMGDVKLAAALGLGLGLAALPITVLVAALGALAMALLRAWRKRRPLNRLGRVPFGAALALAAVAIRLI